MILDTNAVSALADGNSAFERAVEDVETFALPVIVLGEFRFGVMRSRHRRRYERWLSSLVEVSIVLDIDADTADRYAIIREELRKKGRPIPSNDTWIAALALQHGLVIVSRDLHFDQVAGLKRRAW